MISWIDDWVTALVYKICLIVSYYLASAKLVTLNPNTVPTNKTDAADHKATCHTKSNARGQRPRCLLTSHVLRQRALSRRQRRALTFIVRVIWLQCSNRALPTNMARLSVD